MTTVEVNKSRVSSTDDKFSQSPSRLKVSTMTILNAIGSRFFAPNKAQEDSEKLTEKSETESVHSNKSNRSNKSNKSNKSKQEEEPAEEKPRIVPKEKKSVQLRKRPDNHVEIKFKLEREFRRFRSRYNNGLGNIVRSWMNLIYCVLILRMNVVKLILQRIQESNLEDCELERQIRFESKIIYKMIREAQNYSQERSLFLWSQLEKLILSRSVIRSALEEVHDKELALRDWKGAATKLEQSKRDAERLKAEADAVVHTKTKANEEMKGKLAELEAAEEAKEQEVKHLLHEISELKRKEVKLRGKVLLKMKNYKELKAKKENMAHIEKELAELKDQQATMAKEYTDKIQSLKSEIEEKEKLINVERGEKKKLKANLKGLGDQNLNNIVKDESVS